MRWGDFRRSENVEDRTGQSAGGGFPVGGLPIGGGALVIIVIVGMLFGINPLDMLGMLGGGGGGETVQQVAPQRSANNPAEATRKDFSAAILGDTEDVWGAVFRQMGRQYVAPTLVLFHGATRSGCGVAQAQVGPFYCPADRKLYLDTNFFDELRRRFGASGDFGQAYVIAHEVGHHVQNLLGTMERAQGEMQQGGRRANALSVRLELQADCYAGVWGFYAKKRSVIDTSDIQSGLSAAAAVGDDNIQRATQGHVVPDSFTHGSAEQRTHWFRTGLESGDPRDCNTFAPGSP